MTGHSWNGCDDWKGLNMSGNGWKQLKMAWNDKKWLEWLEMAGHG